jgi:hypothetical protein
MLIAAFRGPHAAGHQISPRAYKGMLFSGKFGATESPSAALVGLNRGPLAFLRFTLGRWRCQSGTTGALSDVSSLERFAFFFEPTIT